MQALGAGLPALVALPTRAMVSDARKLLFQHAHTHEYLDVVYARDGSYDTGALDSVNHFLRDWRTDDILSMDTYLLETLHDLQAILGSRARYEVVSGYRSPRTNRRLASISTGVDEDSFHMRGQAIDVRLTDVPTFELMTAARKLGRGGVGYYPRSNFVHIDTGPVRYWGP